MSQRVDLTSFFTRRQSDLRYLKSPVPVNPPTALSQQSSAIVQGTQDFYAYIDVHLTDPTLPAGVNAPQYIQAYLFIYSYVSAGVTVVRSIYLPWNSSGVYRVQPVPPGAAVAINAQAVDFSGQRSVNSSTLNATAAPDTTAPAAPTISGSAVNSGGQINITSGLNSESDFDHYELWRGTGPDISHITWDVAPVIKFFGTSIVDTAIAVSTTYWYKVIVKDFSGNSATSNIAGPLALSSTAESPPATPDMTGATAVANTNGTITFSFHPNTDPTLSAYRIWRRVHGATSWLLLTSFTAAPGTPDPVTYIDIETVIGVQYDYTVTALSSTTAESGFPAAFVTATAADTLAPGPVSNVTIAGRLGGVLVKWTPSTATDVVSYSTNYRLTTAGAFQASDELVTSNSLQILGLTATRDALANQLQVRIIAVDRVGNQSTSVLQTADFPSLAGYRPADNTVPVGPASITVTKNDDGSVLLSWPASISADRSGYQVEIWDTTTTSWTILANIDNDQGGTISYRVIGLEPYKFRNKQYRFRVRTIDYSGNISSVNLVDNSGFETGDTSYWSFNSAGGGVAQVLNSGAFEGTYCLKINYASYAYQSIPVTVGTIYSFSAYAKQDAAFPAEPTLVAIDWYTIGGVFISTSASSTAATSSTYQRYAVTAAAPATAAIARVWLAAGGSGNPTHTVIFDAVQFEQVAFATGYSDGKTPLVNAIDNQAPQDYFNVSGTNFLNLSAQGMLGQITLHWSNPPSSFSGAFDYIGGVFEIWRQVTSSNQSTLAVDGAPRKIVEVPAHADAAANKFDDLDPIETASVTATYFLKARDRYGNSSPTFLNGGTGVSAASLTLSQNQDSIVHEGTASGVGNCFSYRQISTQSYIAAAGDKLEYDVFIELNTANTYKYALEFEYGGSNTAFRGDGKVDQNGLLSHPATDLSSRAKATWYHRIFDIGYLAGQTINSWASAHEGDAAGKYRGRLANIKVTNGSILKAIIYSSGTLPSTPVFFGTESQYTNVSVFTSDLSLGSVNLDLQVSDGVTYIRGTSRVFSEEIDNCDFDLSPALPPPGWTNYGVLGAITLAYDTTTQYSGAQSLKLTATDRYRGVIAVKAYAVRAGDVYKFSGAIKWVSGIMQPRWTVQFVNTGTIVGSVLLNAVNDGTWHLLSGTGTVPAAATVMYILTECEYITSAGSTVWEVDHIQLQRVRSLDDEVRDGPSFKRVASSTAIQRWKITSAGLSSGGTTSFAKNNSSIYGGARSYNVLVIDRATMNVDSQTTYDVFASSANASTMAAALNALGGNKIVLLASYDEPQANRLSVGLQAAMERCGASRVYSSSAFKVRSAYILVGYPGIGLGNGLELYSGSIDNDPNAKIETSVTIIDGEIQGLRSGVPFAFTTDELPDGGTYGRSLLARLNAGRPWIDFSEAIHLSKHLGFIGDDASSLRFAVREIDINRRGIIDLSQGHYNRNLDWIADTGSRYAAIEARAEANRMGVGNLVYNGGFDVGDTRNWRSADRDHNLFYTDPAFIFADPSAAEGGYLAAFNGNAIDVGTSRLIPVNPNKRYYMEVRLKGDGSHATHFYAGFACFDKDKLYIPNPVGSTYNYLVAADVATPSTLTVYSGTTTPGEQAYNAGGGGYPDQSMMRAGTKFITPLLLLNRNVAGGTTYVDYFKIVEIDSTVQPHPRVSSLDDLGRLDFSLTHRFKHLGNISDDNSGGRVARRQYRLVVGSPGGWRKLGTWSFPTPDGLGHTIKVQLVGGSGYNTGGSNQGFADLIVRSSNGSSGAPNISGATWLGTGNFSPITDFKVVAVGGSTSQTNGDWELWVLAQSFADFEATVLVGVGDTFTWAGTSGSDPGAASSTVAVATGQKFLDHTGIITPTGLDFARGYTGKHQDNIPDGSSWGRSLLTRLNAGRPLIDFSESIHISKIIDFMGDGTYYKPRTGITTPTDLPYNGNFETFPDSVNVADGWTQDFESSGAGYSYARTTSSFNGLYAQSITNNGAGGGTAIAARPFGVRPTVNYTFSMRAKSTAANPASMYFRILWFSSDNDVSRGSAQVISINDIVSAAGPTVANTYQFFTGTLSAPAGAQFCRIALYNWSGSLNTMTFDTVTVRVSDAGSLDTATDGSTYGRGILGSYGAFGPNTKLTGFAINDNPDFINGLTRYNIYDNNGSGNVSLSLVADSTAPNSSGQKMRISIAGAGESPGWGGFYLGFVPDNGSAQVMQYHRGNTIVYKIVANIPSGYGIEWASNAFGDQGTFTWLSSKNGTGAWATYIGKQVIGTSGTFSSTGFFYLVGGSSPPSSWDVAHCEAVDIDQAQRYGVRSIDTNQRAIIDFSQTLHISKILDNINDGSTYGRPLNSRLSAGRPFIDFTESIHIGKILDNVGDGSVYARVSVSALTSNLVDMAKGGVVGKPTEYVRNPGFESGDRDWSVGGGYAIISDSGNAYAGSWVLRYQGTVSSATRNSILVAVQPGDPLQASCMIKRTGGNGDCYVRISWCDASGAEIATSAGNAVTSSSYASSRVVANAPSGVAFGRIEATMTSATTTTTAYYDQFNLTTPLKNTDELGDGTGSPLTGGKRGFGALTASFNLSANIKIGGDSGIPCSGNILSTTDIYIQSSGTTKVRINNTSGQQWSVASI
jgi:hypothetical protein